MKISLDGGTTFQEAPNGVRIILEEQDVPGEDQAGELHFNFTGEGLVTDVWATRAEPLDQYIATESVTFVEIIERLVEENS